MFPMKITSWPAHAPVACGAQWTVEQHGFPPVPLTNTKAYPVYHRTPAAGIPMYGITAQERPTAHRQRRQALTTSVTAYSSQSIVAVHGRYLRQPKQQTSQLLTPGANSSGISLQIPLIR